MGKGGYETEGSISYSSPVIDNNGMVFIGSDDGNLYAMVVDQRPSQILLNPGQVYEQKSQEPDPENTNPQPDITNGELVGTLTSISPVLDDEFTYELIDGADERFELVNDNGTYKIQVKDVTMLNYEDEQSHTIRVKTINSRGLEYEQDIVINLLPVNEYPPTDMYLSNTSISEPTTGGTGIWARSLASFLSRMGQTATMLTVEITIPLPGNRIPVLAVLKWSIMSYAFLMKPTLTAKQLIRMNKQSLSG